MAFHPNRETWVEMDELANHRRLWRVAFDAQKRVDRLLGQYRYFNLTYIHITP